MTLKKLYPSASWEKILEGIPFRSEKAIRVKASKLGIKRRHKRRTRTWLKRSGKDLSDVEAAYIAGFLDGEGYIGVVNGRPVISVVNTSRENLTWISEKVGGRVYQRKASKGRKTAFQLRVSRLADIKYLLQRISLFVVGKKKDVELALAALHV